jgi:hypothetical protein
VTEACGAQVLDHYAQQHACRDASVTLPSLLCSSARGFFFIVGCFAVLQMIHENQNMNTETGMRLILN